MCTSELFDADTQRAELLFKIFSKEETANKPPSVGYDPLYCSEPAGMFEVTTLSHYRVPSLVYTKHCLHIMYSSSYGIQLVAST